MYAIECVGTCSAAAAAAVSANLGANWFDAAAAAAVIALYAIDSRRERMVGLLYI